MRTVSIEVPEAAFAALRKAPEQFAREMRLAAAVKWYEIGELSQGKAAEIAGLTRAEFILSLERFRVSPLQYTAEELREELARENDCIQVAHIRAD
jgi:predicted HTH domain antitoxin